MPLSALQGRDMAVAARQASRQLQGLRSEDRVAILNRIADSLVSHEQQIMAENAVDVAAATGKVSEALLQRLVLKPNKIHQLAGRAGCLGGCCVGGKLGWASRGGPEREPDWMGAVTAVNGRIMLLSTRPPLAAFCAPPADGIRAIAKQEEPVGRLLSRMEVAEGLVLDKVCVCVCL